MLLIASDVFCFKSHTNIAADLLSCEISVRNDAIVPDKFLLTSELCQFIYNEPPLGSLES